MNRKIYVVGRGYSEYANWCEGDIVNSIHDANLVLFAGGEDVSPNLYLSKTIHPRTYSNPARDHFEEQIYEHCKSHGVKMLGICRGSQFLCAMAGGILVQHQSGTGFIHPIQTSRGVTLPMSSTHHQAMYPWGLPESDYKVLGWSTGESPYHENGDRCEMINEIVPDNKECEIVWFKKNPSLNIQGHPEMIFGNDHKETIQYCRELLNKFMNDEEVD